MGKAARDRRTRDRDRANGYLSSIKASQRYWKWAKTYKNVKVYGEHGPYFAWGRPMLIKNGGKP